MCAINTLHGTSTYDESQQLVGQQAGGDEGHQETNVQLLGQLWLNPHKQTANAHAAFNGDHWQRASSVQVYSQAQENSLLDFLQDVRHLAKQVLFGPTWAHGCCEMFLCRASTLCCGASPELSERRPEPAGTSPTQSAPPLEAPEEQTHTHIDPPARRQRVTLSSSDQGHYSPQAPRLPAQCSTGSSSLWQQCIMGERNPFTLLQRSWLERS